jgi:DNA-binding transcriptional ArsR family regulator
LPLRVHFTAEDLARTRVATEPDPMWELVTSLHRIQAPSDLRYRPWLGHVRTRMRATPRLRGSLRVLTMLVPERGAFPDFLTPPSTSGYEGFDGALELIGATPQHRVRPDLATTYRRGRMPSWVRRLADGDRDHRRDLHAAMRVYHSEVVRPVWAELGESFLADRTLRGQALLDGGVDRLLSTLSPSIRWDPPVLTADYPRERDLYLNGRGITLVPSSFCQRNPVSLIDPDLPPVLVYPLTGDRGQVGGSLDAADTAGDLGAVVPEGLAALLGHSRALALLTLRHPCSTTELARRVGVSAGTASRHATALRAAGLVTSTRHRNLMVHHVTRLGRQLTATA